MKNLCIHRLHYLFSAVLMISFALGVFFLKILLRGATINLQNLFLGAILGLIISGLLIRLKKISFSNDQFPCTSSYLVFTSMEQPHCSSNIRMRLSLRYMFDSLCSKTLILYQKTQQSRLVLIFIRNANFHIDWIKTLLLLFIFFNSLPQYSAKEDAEYWGLTEQ